MEVRQGRDKSKAWLGARQPGPQGRAPIGLSDYLTHKPHAPAVIASNLECGLKKELGRTLIVRLEEKAFSNHRVGFFLRKRKPGRITVAIRDLAVEYFHACRSL